jgi:hypothetical protein
LKDETNEGRVGERLEVIRFVSMANRLSFCSPFSSVCEINDFFSSKASKGTRKTNDKKDVDVVWPVFDESFLLKLSPRPLQTIFPFVSG